MRRPDLGWSNRLLSVEICAKPAKVRIRDKDDEAKTSALHSCISLEIIYSFMDSSPLRWDNLFRCYFNYKRKKNLLVY